MTTKETRPYLVKAGWQASKDGVTWNWTSREPYVSEGPLHLFLLVRYVFTVRCAKGCEAVGDEVTFYSDEIVVRSGNHD